MGAAQETQSPGVSRDCGQLDRFSLWTITWGREELSATSKFKGFPGEPVFGCFLSFYHLPVELRESEGPSLQVGML